MHQNTKRKDIVIILSVIFIVMAGLGITLSELPFYIERLSLQGAIESTNVSLNVTLIIGSFFTMQLLLSPYLGSLSDKFGRRPLIILGLSLFSTAMLFFSFANNLTFFYVTEILAGIASAALSTGSGAYLADRTSLKNRGTYMSLLTGVASMGAVAGAFIVNLFSALNLSFDYRNTYFGFDKFSIPFLISSVLGLLVLMSVLFLLPKTIKVSGASTTETYDQEIKPVKNTLIMLLVLSFISQFSLSMFEGTFGIHSQKFSNFGPEKISIIFIICGSVMSVLQLGPITWLIRRKGESFLLPYGFIFMGTGMLLLMTTQLMALMLVYVSLISIGMAILIPSLISLTTKCSAKRHGELLGIFGSVNSSGQVFGVLVGGAILIWYQHLSYWLVSAILFSTAAWIFIRLRSSNIIKASEMSKD